MVHPYRVVYAQGGWYLLAFVPAYSEVRTFAVDRIARMTAKDDTFTPAGELESDPFRNSLGVHRGPACKVQLRFDGQIAPFVRERTWHSSQQLRDRSDGALTMSLEVCDDYALRNWILGFGRYVRVLAPASLANWVLEELDNARQQYVAGDGTVRVIDGDVQPALPFMFSRLASA